MVNKFLVPILNKQINSIPLSYQIIPGIEIDYKAMMNPVIKNDFLGIFLSGEVHQVGKSVPFISEMKIPSTPL